MHRTWLVREEGGADGGFRFRVSTIAVGLGLGLGLGIGIGDRVQG